MSDRQPAEEVTRGLETTSAKIRALAQAGYDRTEIAEQLGIRYQHVRKVLVDAGITAGLRRQVQAESEPVAVDAEPASARLSAPRCFCVLASSLSANGSSSRWRNDT